jgi:hypothetical protein
MRRREGLKSFCSDRRRKTRMRPDGGQEKKKRRCFFLFGGEDAKTSQALRKTASPDRDEYLFLPKSRLSIVHPPSSITSIHQGSDGYDSQMARRQMLNHSVGAGKKVQLA